MEPVKLVLINFPPSPREKEDAQAIRDALSPSVPVSEPNWQGQLSFDLPPIIELLSSIDTWSIFKNAARISLMTFSGAFMGTLGKKAADSTVEAIQNKLKRPDKHGSSLDNLATTLKLINDRNHQEVEIRIGLNASDNSYEAILSTHAKDCSKFIRDLSIFMVNAEKIDSECRSATENNNIKSIVHFSIKLEDNGNIILHWRDDSDHHNHTKHIT
ncbi:hypothetical protein [Candidatus Synechococcus spongiarum]|uniref:hypothetical protein n=1 Tax=Candidatus Synechococcus spongiarum TaxID=431041 RepID=UPI001178132D|nr:hypothetical protein [Candidatus Synechococcus spongiarum]